MTRKESLQYNLGVLAAALQSVGADRAEADYSGHNDQGGVDEFRIIRQDGTQISYPGDITYKRVGRLFIGGKSESEVETITADFDSALNDLLYDALDENGERGWELNSGSDGHFTLYADGRMELNHSGWQYKLAAPSAQTAGRRP